MSSGIRVGGVLVAVAAAGNVWLSGVAPDVQDSVLQLKFKWISSLKFRLISISA